MTRKEKERAGKSVRTVKETRRRRLPVSRTRQIVLVEVSATVIDSQLYLVLLVKRQYCKAKKKKNKKKILQQRYFAACTFRAKYEMLWYHSRTEEPKYCSGIS